MPEILRSSDVIRNAYPIGWQNRTLIECGAARNGNELMPMSAENSCWFIEADPDYFDELCTHTRGVRTLRYALTDYDGEVTFSQSSHYGNGSVNYSEPHLRELASIANKTVRIQVPCLSYRTLIEQHIRGPVDCFVLDIEGNEATVLRSMASLPPPPVKRWWNWFRPSRPAAPSLPAIFVVECGYDWPVRLDLLRGLGYRLDFYHFNNGFLSLPAAVSKNQRYIDSVKWDRFDWFGQTIYDATQPDSAPAHAES